MPFLPSNAGYACSELIEHEALSWGIGRKYPCMLAKIMFLKSQAPTLGGYETANQKRALALWMACATDSSEVYSEAFQKPIASVAPNMRDKIRLRHLVVVVAIRYPDERVPCITREGRPTRKDQHSPKRS
jgi:hypothetical protein